MMVKELSLQLTLRMNGRLFYAYDSMGGGLAVQILDKPKLSSTVQIMLDTRTCSHEITEVKQHDLGLPFKSG